MTGADDGPTPERQAPSSGPPDDRSADARHLDSVRLVEAILFSSAEPVPEADLKARLPADGALSAVLRDLQAHYAGRGVILMPVAGGWAFRTAPDLAARLRETMPVPRKLSRAALETLAIIAYHQPVTRSEIESIRGVAVSKGTVDVLLEAGWVRPGRRRESPGRPLTWVTGPGFLNHFGLAAIDDLPGLADLRAAGLLEPHATGTGPAAPDGGQTEPEGSETDSDPTGAGAAGPDPTGADTAGDNADATPDPL